jgi:hypothetical protein
MNHTIIIKFNYLTFKKITTYYYYFNDVKKVSSFFHLKINNNLVKFLVSNFPDLAIFVGKKNANLRFFFF